MKSVVFKIVLILSLFNFTVLNGQVTNMSDAEKGFCYGKVFISKESKFDTIYTTYYVLNEVNPLVQVKTKTKEISLEYNEEWIKAYRYGSYEMLWEIDGSVVESKSIEIVNRRSRKKLRINQIDTIVLESKIKLPPDESGFVKVLCKNQVDDQFIIALQKALIIEGYLDSSHEIIQTVHEAAQNPMVVFEALKEYQVDNDFIQAAFTIESLTALGIDY